MFLVGFELTIPAFERAKTVHALDSTATVLDLDIVYHPIFYLNHKCTGLNGVIHKKIKLFIVIDMITPYPTLSELINVHISYLYTWKSTEYFNSEFPALFMKIQ
jgi:hypothetical protein